MSGRVVAACIWIVLGCHATSGNITTTTGTVPYAGKAVLQELREMKEVMKSMHQTLSSLYSAVESGSSLDAAPTETKQNSRLTDVETRVTDTERRLADMETRLTDTMSKLRTTQTKLETTQTELEGTKAELEGTKTQLEGTKTQLEGTKTELEGTKVKLETTETALQSAQTDWNRKFAKLNRSVAFDVWHKSNPMRTGSGKTLIMDHVLTNIGQGYDSFTGVFTAPVSGLYDFQVSFMSYADETKKVYAAIMVDVQEVARGVADSGHRYWDQSSIRAIVHVTSGQKVYVKNISSSKAAYYSASNEPYTTFSGFLVKAD